MEEPTHEIERKILLKLIHTPSANFNELWNKEGESNTFSYHITKLEQKELISKNQNGAYSLTEKGKQLSAFIEGDTGKRAEFPTFVVVILVQNGDKWLCQKRMKEPFYGYWGFVAGKINFGQNLFECATRDLMEEAGLKSEDWKLKAFEQIKTFENGKLIHHHYLFHVYTNKFEGAFKEKTHKAEHAWLTLEEYKSKERFPSDWIFTHIIPAQNPIMFEAERYMENGKFVGSKLIEINGHGGI